MTDRSFVRWWFENRETGELTVAQFPNWPVFAIGVATVTRRIVDDGSRIQAITGFVGPLLWIYWAGDELIRGVNPWRRVIGVLVLLWQVSPVVA
ncbi:MAG: hypothetical protein HOH36_03620 [Acidimicrobiaceae bacterium]|jgi:hypothetical protein|nr:hypothetical protein [Acidimicrobiaceae bacterium]MBT5581961.1 hypothetical protein [Acidimicrobiaceae bacterium]MBT5849507.1 hypothetical protein [Acidimicrobiaceae bacterium]